MTKVTVTVNGKSVSRDVEGRTLLSSFLRDGLGMTGTHIGCETTHCGACTVDLDGKSVKSCTLLAVQAQGASVTTLGRMGCAMAWFQVLPMSSIAQPMPTL